MAKHADSLNSVLRRATARALDLEARLAGVLTPILNAAAGEAADRFERTATTLTATADAREADAWTLASLGRDEARRLVRSLVLTAAVPGVTAQSTMIAVKPRPDEAAALADPDGEAPETLHVTLVYIGETDGPLEPIAEALRPVAAAHAPLEGVVGGYGQFEAPDGSRVGILLPDVPGLVELRVAVTEALAERGIDYARSHGFEAHITIDADPEPGELDETLRRAAQAPLHFDDLLLLRGDAEVVPFPLIGMRPVTAAGPPRWTPPTGSEVLDVDALVSVLHGRTDPVRRAVVETVVKAGIGQPDGPTTQRVTSAAEAKELKAEAKALRQEAGAGKAEQLIQTAVRLFDPDDPEARLHIIRDADGKLRGAYSYIIKSDKVGDGQIGSTIRGGGTALIREAAADAAERGIPLTVAPVGDSQGFYEKIGFERGGSGIWKLEGDALKSLASSGGGALGLSFDVTNPFVAKVLAQSGSQITNVAETTRQDAQRIIKASYAEGLSIRDTATAIRAGMREANTARATLIARTELAGAVNGGSLAATRIVAAATDVVYSKKWLVGEGARYPRHETYDGLDGQTVPLDGLFDVGGASLDHPGDPSGPPEEVCNCRCTLVYETPEGDVDVETGDEG